MKYLFSLILIVFSLAGYQPALYAPTNTGVPTPSTQSQSATSPPLMNPSGFHPYDCGVYLVFTCFPFKICFMLMLFIFHLWSFDPLFLSLFLSFMSIIFHSMLLKLESLKCYFLLLNYYILISWNETVNLIISMIGKIS